MVCRAKKVWGGGGQAIERGWLLVGPASPSTFQIIPLHFSCATEIGKKKEKCLLQFAYQKGNQKNREPIELGCPWVRGEAAQFMTNVAGGKEMMVTF